MHVRLRRVARLIFGFTCVCAVIYYLSTSHNHGDSATRRHPPARPGTCTLLINVFSRPETVRDTLQHYAGSSVIDHIVVIWASPVPTGDLAELLPAEDGRPPISFVYPPSSSLNYRFYPWPEIQNDCVMHMDDDWRMPLDHVERVVQVWHTPGYSRLWVGLEHMGRSHVYRPASSSSAVEPDALLPVYAPTFWSQYAAHPTVMPPSSFHSIVLPSGGALSLSYMRHYTTSPALASARAVVDELTNCEDLLMNLVVANLTHAGPVFVRAWHKPFQKDGLWFRPKHLSERSDCLQRFEELGITGLRYSEAYIALGDAAGVEEQDEGIPPLTAWTFSEEIPVELPCTRTVFDEQGICELADSPAGLARIGQDWA